MRKRSNWRKNSLKWVVTTRRRFVRHWRSLKQWQRVLCGCFAVVILLSAIIPTIESIITGRRYRLDHATLGLVGTVNQNLASKLTYDDSQAQWDFNAADLSTSSATSLKAQAGGGGKDDESLYATTLPQDPKKGITFTDSQTQLAFRMIPQFSLDTGRNVDGHLVYPMKHSAKLIYTPKNNGMKEDIVLPKFIDNDLSFSYKLNLPNTLTARLQSDGSVGIFSADPILFGKISTASNMDSEKLKSARENAKKDHLLFALPAPIIKQAGGSDAPVNTQFSLTGNTLTVTAHNMGKVHYPASVDPSIVVTSASDFATGNDEDNNITYGSSQTGLSGVTGGTISAWQTTTSLTTTRDLSQTVYSNGYLYLIGGETDCGATTCRSVITDGSAVQRAQVNNDGTLGIWQNTASLPGSNGYATNFQSFAYNSRLYIMGHINTNYNAVYVAPIYSDGTLGAWVATTSLPQNNNALGATVSNGYVYAVGGGPSAGGGTYYNTVYYSHVKADGTLGAWVATSNLPDTVGMQVALTYNGYLYSIGGANASGLVNTIYYAKIKSDGSVGNWLTTNNFTTPRYGHVAYAYDGYMYIVGGWTSNDTQYAMINANGSLNPWAASTSYNAAGGERYSSGIAHNGYLYTMGGRTSGGTGVASSTVQYAKIDPPGSTTTSTTLTAFGSTIDAGVGCAGFMYGNYLYCAGGYTGTDYTKQVRYAQINGDGTIGTWQTTSALQTPISGGSGLGAQGYAISNNHIYMIGGTTNVAGTATNVSSIQYATFNTDGTLSSWTLNPTNYVGAVSNQTATAYNGYLYATGYSGGGGTNRVYVAQINNDGTVGTWNWDGNGNNNFTFTTSLESMIAYRGYLYIVGGNNGTTYYNNVAYAPINSDGSVGTWGSTSTLNTGRSRFGVVIINGYIYAVGGQTGSSSYTGSVEYAPISSNGTLGTWTAGTDMATTARNFGIASRNDSIYVMGGVSSGTYGKTVLSLKTRGGGGGINNGWTTSSSTLATGRQYHASAVANGYLYVLGGKDSGGNYLASIEYAKLGDDGSVGSFTTTTTLPSGRIKFGVATYNGNMYIFGGEGASATLTNTTYSAPLHSDGTLGSWSSQTVLPDQLSGMAVAQSDNRIYLLGGMKTAASNQVIYTVMNTDGTLGTWNTTAAFNSARYGAGAVTNGNYLYVLGGLNDTGASLSDVQYAPINSDGTLGSWSRTTDMNYSRAYLTPTVLDGFLYVYGGYDSTYGSRNNVGYAPLAAGGGVGSWSSGSSFSGNRSGSQVVLSNGYAYLSGGSGGGTYFNDVQSSSFQVQPRIAHYSKQFDLGGIYNLSGISYTGNLPNSTTAISYSGAGADGVFGSAQSATNIPTSNKVFTCNAGAVRYIFTQVSLDNSQASVFPASSSTPAYLGSLTVSYNQSHPTPDKRLAHGKSFQNGSLQPLDTCAG